MMAMLAVMAPGHLPVCPIVLVLQLLVKPGVFLGRQTLLMRVLVNLVQPVVSIPVLPIQRIMLMLVLVFTSDLRVCLIVLVLELPMKPGVFLR